MILRPVYAGTGANAEKTAELSGTYDGTNRIFELPEPVLHSPPIPSVKLYHGGRRMKHREFEVFESVVGSGLDRVRLTEFSPGPNAILFADYQAA